MSELQRKLKALAEKKAIVSWGGHNYSLAPEGTGVGVEAGIDHGYGVVPLPYVGVDVGTPHNGVRIGGPLPHIGLRSGLYSRTPGAASNPGSGKSLWGWLSQRGKSKKEVAHEDSVNSAARFRHLDPEDIAREMGTFDQWKKLPMKSRLEIANELVRRGQEYEKQSKVYEATEPVQNMTVKQTKMNHKQCSPGEFGAMVKESANPWARLAGGVSTAMGNVGGALTQGAPQAAQKAMLAQRQNLRPIMGIVPGGNARQSLQQAGREAFKDTVHSNSLAAAGAGAAGAGFGYGVKYHGAYNDEQDRLLAPAWTHPSMRGKSPAEAGMVPQPARGNHVIKTVSGNLLKTNSARDFGAYVKQSFNIGDYLPKGLHEHLPGAGLGAGLGAGIGAIGGLINPGEEDEYDDNGRVVGRKQRSRFGAMMRNALAGAGVGGLAGGAASYMSPTFRKAVTVGRAALDPANNQEVRAIQQGKPLPANMRIPSDLRLTYNANQYGADIANSFDRVIRDQYDMANRPSVNYNEFADVARNDVTGQDMPAVNDALFPQYGVPGGNVGPALPNQ